MADQISQIAIPITPDIIIEQLKSSELFEGQYQFYGRSDTVLVPAGGVVTLDVYPNLNYINVNYKHHTISSDYYDPDLYFELRIDVSRFILTPSPVSLNSEKELSLAYYLPIKIKKSYTFTNNTLTDANITMYVEDVQMSRSFFEKWYKVILKYSEDQLNNLVDQVGI